MNSKNVLIRDKENIRPSGNFGNHTKPKNFIKPNFSQKSIILSQPFKNFSEEIINPQIVS